MQISVWNSKETIGYEQKTTFWMDFSIADNFGNSAIKDTYRRAFNGWKTDCVYLTELVMVLNQKCWEWYSRGDETRSELYSDLYYKTDAYALENLKGEDLSYYLETTD